MHAHPVIRDHGWYRTFEWPHNAFGWLCHCGEQRGVGHEMTMFFGIESAILDAERHQRWHQQQRMDADLADRAAVGGI